MNIDTFLYFPFIYSRFIKIQMCVFQLFLSVDPSLGRVDYSLMSDQTLMEMLIDGFDDNAKKNYQDAASMYLDVCTWSCVHCDGDERVIRIDMETSSITGSLQLCYVPLKANVVNMRSWGKSKMTGSVDLARLPDGMTELSLDNNVLTGEIDLTHLPGGMTELSLYDNQLTGEIDLTNLPKGMTLLCLNSNQLTGKIYLNQLPSCMRKLYLNSNQFIGEVDLTQLPDGIKDFHLEDNMFTGEINLAHLPDGMEYLHLANNQFSGGIDLSQLPSRMRELYLNNNQLTGEVVITNDRLLLWMSTINAQGNQFNALAVVDSETDANILLRGSGVTSVVDENGEEQDMTRFM